MVERVLMDAWDSVVRLRFRPSCPGSPTPHPRINLISCNTISYQPHRNSQDLDILIPALIIEEQHLIVLDATISMYPCKMCRLATRVYLHVIKVVYRAS
jgi:hypothetical protein